ncbi:MAG TPA: aldo/keto reductase [Verrucomicrobiae bacterium]|nr:aldo/keto reductase [Verrucomicrobiae bacterium]
MIAGIAKLGLGTVQFGLDYGVTNLRGRVSSDEASRIVDDAIAAGLRVFDTAAAYGDSETILGQILRHPEARIVTKLPALAGESIDAAAIDAFRRIFEESLKRLRRQDVHGLLLHRPDDLRKPGGDKLARLLEDLKSAGLCRKIGVSVYDAAQVKAAQKSISVELVQAPANLLDQRLLQDGSLRALKDAGCEVHVRSAFLQGLLIECDGPLPAYFEPYAPMLDRVRATAAEASLSTLQLALGFLLGQPDIDYVIFGVTRTEELAAILNAARREMTMPGGLEKLACDVPGLINPSLWPSTK